MKMMLNFIIYRIPFVKIKLLVIRLSLHQVSTLVSAGFNAKVIKINSRVFIIKGTPQLALAKTIAIYCLKMVSFHYHFFSNLGFSRHYFSSVDSMFRSNIWYVVIWQILLTLSRVPLPRSIIFQFEQPWVTARNFEIFIKCL